MTEKAQDDVRETREKISEIKRDIGELELDLREAIAKVTSRYDSVPNEVSITEVKPSRNDVKVDLLGVAWVRTFTR